MSRKFANKVLLAMPAMLLCAGFAQAQAPPASPLTATWATSPAAVALSYQLPSQVSPPTVTVTFTAAVAHTFDIDPSTVPFWLSQGAPSGQAQPAPNGATVVLQASQAAATLGVGTYNASLHAKVSGFADLVVPVTLSVNNTPSTLSVTQTTTPPAINWIYGSAYPTQTLTIVSSDQPVPFSVTTQNTTANAPANWITVSATAGIAYNFGTSITVNFLHDVLYNAVVGQALTGTVTVHYGAASPGGTDIVVSLTINVTEPFAAVTSIFPSQAPPSTTTALSVVVTGTGFGSVASGYPNPTGVTIAYNGAGPVSLTGGLVGGTITVVNPTTMVLSIPANDTAGTPVNILAAGNVTLTISNGLGSDPVQSKTLTLTSNPIIYSVTDSASLVEAAPGSSPSLAPYELVTLFGAGFDSGAAVAGTLDSFSRYPNSLSVPAVAGHTLTVSFYKQGVIGAGTHIADAYLVYVSNSQINCIVPSGVTAAGITQLQVVVTYNGNASTAYTATPANTNPGVFTTASSGQGQGAILLPNFSVNSSTNKAAKNSIVMIYVSGLGTPNSTATDVTSTAAIKFPGSCISPASYVTAEALVNPATDDGAVILASKIASGHLPPCLATSGAVTVTIGGKSATVGYAGWVADSVAGLYQINATVPATAASGNSIPVVVTAGGVSSQAGVTMAIQ